MTPYLKHDLLLVDVSLSIFNNEPPETARVGWGSGTPNNGTS